MTLPSSGEISLLDVFNEFGPYAATGSALSEAPHGLDEFYSLGNKTSYFTGRSVTDVPNSGPISLHDFYDKSKDLEFSVIGTRNSLTQGSYTINFTFNSLGFVPGGSLNRYYVVVLARPYGLNQIGVTMSFDGGAAVSANHTASGTYTTTIKGETTTLAAQSRVSIWIYKKNTGTSLSVVSNNNTYYHMAVFEIYTQHGMTAAKRTFYSREGPTCSITVNTPVVGSLFIQSATNDENSEGSPLNSLRWAELTYGPTENGFSDLVMLRGGSFGRASTWSRISATYLPSTTTRTFSMIDDRSRQDQRKQVSAGMYIVP